jgi:hypothetical protein
VKRLFFVVLGLAALCCNLPRLSARADVPTVSYSGSFSAPGYLPDISLAGQSACAVTVDVSGGTGTVTPFGASDGLGIAAATGGVIPSIGAQTTSGIFGGSTLPYLTDFQAGVDVVTGTVNVTETCSGAIGTYTPGPTPTPIPTFSPTPTPGPTATPPTPTPSPTPSSCTQAIASTSPALFYKLDATPSPGATAVVDSSGNGYTGTITNPTFVTLGLPALATPEPGNAFSFGFAYPGYLSVPTSLPAPGLGYSVVALINGPYTAGSHRNCVFDYYGYCFSVSNGFLGWGVIGSGRFSQVIALTPGTTYFVALSANTSASPFVINVSVNGATYIASPTGVGRGPVPQGFSYINAASAFPNPAVITQIDDLALLPYTLSQAQVTALASFCAPVPTASPTPVPTPSPTPTAGGYAAVVAGYNPLAYYRLDDTTTTVADTAGFGYNGTISGSYTQSASSLLVGDADTATTFSGGLVTLPMIPVYNVYSAAMLIHASSYGSIHAIFDYGGQAVVAKGNSLQMCFDAGGSQCTGSNASPTLSNGTTYFVVFEVNHAVGGLNSIQVSVNHANLVGLNSSNFGTNIRNGNNFIAHSTYANFSGTVDEVAIFPNLLTQAQINNLALHAGY